MIYHLQKEICNHCQKNIGLGQSHFECLGCNRILHAKCFKPSEAQLINNNFYCMSCKHSVPKIYDPYKALIDLEDDNADPYIQKMSDVLQNCRPYTTKKLNTEIKSKLYENFSMLFQNIDGNRTNFDAFSVELDRITERFKVIGLAETNVGTDESNVYCLDGYNCFYQGKHVNKSKGTGVALYLDDSLNGVVNDQVSWVSKNLETLFVTIQSDKPVHIGVVYRPPSGSALEALEELRKVFELCPNENVHILGDFNLNLHDETSALVNDFENLILGAGMTPLISISTHYKPGCKPSCIDNILTNDIENLVLSGTLNTCISHHHAVFHVLKSPLMQIREEKQKFAQYYDYCNRNVNKFLESLNEELTRDPPSNFSDFSSLFNCHLDKACKLEKPRFSKRTAKEKPWITCGLISSINRKHELYDLWKTAEKVKCLCESGTDGRCQPCIETLRRREEFRDHRRLLNHLINCAKRKYHGEKIQECSGDSKKTWQIINELRGKKRRQVKPNFIIDNERIKNRRIIANEFNKYFASIASNLNEVYSGDQVRISSLPSFTDYLPKSESSSIYLRECDYDEIMKIINELTNGKSSDIPIHVIKKASQIISPFLVKFFNECLMDGYFPDELKTGRISPIYKKEDEQLLENYRPVSTLPVFGKILEKLIYVRFYNFFVSKGIIHENQYGFRKGHSTSHALNYSVEHVQSLISKKQHVLGIFIDLSKAFDTIDHRKLKTKLNNYGIRGNALKLIDSYLSDRKQYVSVLDTNSEELPVRFGVPQGSVLGPLLFILYINDICNITDKGKFVLFADDTNIFVAAESKKKAYDTANEVLLAVSNYMEVNLLHINVKKCCYMYFSPTKRPNTEGSDADCLNLSINSRIISQVSETKFLGVIIDDKLSWKPQILSLNRKLRSACGRLYRIKKCLPESLYEQLYHSLFESHLGFAISVWGGVSSNQLKPLFITQKMCIRILFGNSENYNDKFRTCARARPFHSQRLGNDFYVKESTKPLFNKHELLAVENLYRYRCLMELFTIVKSRTPVSLYYLFNISNRKDSLLITPSPTNQFLYKSAWLWNNFRKTGLLDFSSPYKSVKGLLKFSLLKAQSMHGTDWCEYNFNDFANDK